MASVADVSDPDAVDQLLNATDEHLGAASILVNAVGISEGRNVFQTDPGQWDRTLAVNVGSYFLCARALGTRLRDRDTPGAIVNISSTAGLVADAAEPPRFYIALAKPDGVIHHSLTRAGHPAIWQPRAAKQALNLLRLTLARET